MISSVIVKKTELLPILKENRENHQSVFEAALGGYRLVMIREFEKRLAEIKTGKKIRRAFTMPVPADHLDDYDQAIEMLEMSVEDQIELSQHEFSCLVRDDWGWKNEFNQTSVSYTGQSE